MKKVVAVIVVVLVLAVLASLLLLSPIGHVILDIAQVKRTESAMQQPSVYKPVARRLALYCQSDQKPFPDYLTYAWFPAELRELGQGSGTIDSTSARIEMGGGFHHFGYFLSLDEARSNETTNVWNLRMYSEDSGGRHLTTVSLPKSKRLTPDEIVTMVADGYEAHAAATPDNRRAHQEKIQMYLRFDRTAPARKACRAMLEKMPSDWWAVLVNSLLDASLGDNANAEKFMIDWVNKDPNFFRYLDLAYFYQLTNQPAKASDAIGKAAKFDANTDWGHDGNSEYRGYTAAMYAYESGQYAQCERFCEKLISVTVNGKYAKRGLNDLRQAAASARRGDISDVEWDDEISPFDPFESIDIEKLLGRKVNRPTKREFWARQQ